MGGYGEAPGGPGYGTPGREATAAALAAYERTGDPDELPEVVVPAFPGAGYRARLLREGADPVAMAALHWYRHLHHPGTAGLPDRRAALALAGAESAGSGSRPGWRRAGAGRGGGPGGARPAGRAALPPELVRAAAPVPAIPRWRRGGGAGRASGGGGGGTLGAARIEQLGALMDRFREGRDPEALVAAVGLQNDWLAETGTAPHERAALLSDQAELVLLLGRFTLDEGGSVGPGERDWYAEAEESAALAVDATSAADHDPHRANRLLLKGSCAELRFVRDRDPAALWEAAHSYGHAAECAGRRQPRDLAPARRLAAVLAALHRETGSAAARDRALSAARKLVRLTDPADRRAARHREPLESLCAETGGTTGGRASGVTGVTGMSGAAGTRDAETGGAETTLPGQLSYAGPDGPRARSGALHTAGDPAAPRAARRAAARTALALIPGDHDDRAPALLLAAETAVEELLDPEGVTEHSGAYGAGTAETPAGPAGPERLRAEATAGRSGGHTDRVGHPGEGVPGDGEPGTPGSGRPAPGEQRARRTAGPGVRDGRQARLEDAGEHGAGTETQDGPRTGTRPAPPARTPRPWRPRGPGAGAPGGTTPGPIPNPAASTAPDAPGPVPVPVPQSASVSVSVAEEEARAAAEQARLWAVCALDALPEGHLLRARALLAHAGAVLCAVRSGVPGAVADDAVDALRAAVPLLRAGGAAEAVRLSAAGRLLVSVARSLNDGSLLPEAVALHRSAVAAAPAAARGPLLAELAAALSESAEAAGPPQQPEPGGPDPGAGVAAAGVRKLVAEARAVAGAALAALPRPESGGARPAGTLLGLARTLLRCDTALARAAGERGHEGAARAAELLDEALEPLEPDAPVRAPLLAALGLVRLWQHGTGGGARRAAEALEAARAAVAATPPGGPEWLDRNDGLGRAATLLLSYRPDGYGPGPALYGTAEAAPRGSAATGGGTDGPGRRPAGAPGTGPEPGAAGAPGGEVSALLRAEALGAWAVVAASRSTPAHRRIEARRHAAELLTGAGRQRAALAELEAALAEIPALAGPGAAAPVRRGTALLAAGLASDTAALAVAAGEPERAVAALEGGRAVLHSRAVASRRYGEPLRKADPYAADRLERIEQRLLRLGRFTDVPVVNVRTVRRTWRGREREESRTRHDPGPAAASRIRRLAAERDRLLARMARDGRFAALTRPRTVAELRRDLAGAPVVLLFARDDGGHALFVPALPDAPVSAVPLPGLTTAAVDGRLAVLEAAVADATSRTAGFDRREEAQAELHGVLEWLWDTVAAPVLARSRPAPPAGPGISGELPRLWWCPVGRLVRLPLHAAGHHRDPLGGGAEAPRTVLDRVVSSSVPTLAALAESLRGAPDAEGPARGRGALVVSVPSVPGLPVLAQAGVEAREVAALVPGSELLADAGAGPEAVAARLPAYPIAHFACHGDGDLGLGALLGRGLHLAGGELLTPGRVHELRLEHGELAFLSACATAGQAPALAALPDEPLHLASAFQLAGFRRVIATLWRTPDSAAIAREVYRELTADGTRPPDPARSAVALNTALRRVRDDCPELPTRWAAHLHAGA
jgi:hypothetical protein